MRSFRKGGFFPIPIFPESGFDSSPEFMLNFSPQYWQAEGIKKDLFLFRGFFLVMDQFAPVDALPVLGQVFPVSPGFHDRIMLCAAHKAFHESRRFVNQFHHFFFFGHATNVDR